jgi:hypothetical protein
MKLLVQVHTVAGGERDITGQFPMGIPCPQVEFTKSKSHRVTDPPETLPASPEVHLQLWRGRGRLQGRWEVDARGSSTLCAEAGFTLLPAVGPSSPTWCWHCQVWGLGGA